jgi:hypothetical protein
MQFSKTQIAALSVSADEYAMFRSIFRQHLGSCL